MRNRFATRCSSSAATSISRPAASTLFQPVHTWGFTQHNQFFALYETRQRAVYQMQQRLRKHPFLGLFDGADTNSSTATRATSTTPPAIALRDERSVHARARGPPRGACSRSQASDEAQRLRPRLSHALCTSAASQRRPRCLPITSGRLAGEEAGCRADQAWTSLAACCSARTNFFISTDR